MTPTYTLEVCVDSMASALAAQAGGAQRIELCSSLLEGGLTPNVGMIEVARQALTLDINVMIRPRGGDFLYSDLEFAVMQRDIEIAKQAGAQGVVLGILTADGELDQARMAALMTAARPLSVTCHRAFDVAVDPFTTLEALIDLGVDRVLTSGSAPNVMQGVSTIAALQARAAGRIIIMPGGGVNEDNAAAIVHQTGVHELHMSGRVTVPSAMRYRKQTVTMGSADDDYRLTVTSAARVRACADALNKL